MDPFQQAGINLSGATVNGMPLAAAFPGGLPPGATVNGIPFSGAAQGGFQPGMNAGANQQQMYFAGGANAPPPGTYNIMQAPPGGIGSLGPEWTKYG